MDHEINTVIISFFDDIQNEGFLPPRYDIFKEASGKEIIFWVEENLKRVFKGVYVKIYNIERQNTCEKYFVKCGFINGFRKI